MHWLQTRHAELKKYSVLISLFPLFRSDFLSVTSRLLKKSSIILKSFFGQCTCNIHCVKSVRVLLVRIFSHLD